MQKPKLLVLPTCSKYVELICNVMRTVASESVCCRDASISISGEMQIQEQRWKLIDAYALAQCMPVH